MTLCALMTAACRGGFETSPATDASAADGATADAEILSCGSRQATEIPASGIVAGSTRFEANEFFGSCGGADSPELVYYIDLDDDAQSLLVDVPRPPASFSPTLYLRRDCDMPAAELICDSSDGDDGAAVLLKDVVPGRYLVFVDGADDAGIFELATTVLDGEGAACETPATGSRCDQGLVCAGTCVPDTCESATAQTDGFTATGSTSGAATTHAGSCTRFGGLKAPEVVFEITLTAAVSNLNATTDRPGTNFDTLLYLRSDCVGTEIACNDDTVDQKSEIDSGPLPAGTYFLFVDGFSTSSGDFEIEVTLTP